MVGVTWYLHVLTWGVLTSLLLTHHLHWISVDPSRRSRVSWQCGEGGRGGGGGAVGLAFA